MKLIFCPACQDVVKLALRSRHCDCGASGGKYYADALHAGIWGRAVPLGFANSSLMAALQERPLEGLGKVFTAFVIPFTCPTVEDLELDPETNA